MVVYRVVRSKAHLEKKSAAPWPALDPPSLGPHQTFFFSSRSKTVFTDFARNMLLFFAIPSTGIRMPIHENDAARITRGRGEPS